jgi:malate/lactate dehydrogenase
MPAVLGRKGIVCTIQTPLTLEEKAEIHKSAEELRDEINQIP